MELKPECIECVNLVECPKSLPNCPINDILDFHMKIMPSRKALMYALEKILEIPFEKIAPQHGSIVKDKKALKFLFKLLTSLKDVGIDGIADDDYNFNFADLDHRFKP